MGLAIDPAVDRVVAGARRAALLEAARALLVRQPKTAREAASIVANLDGPLVDFDPDADARCDECGSLFVVGPMGKCACGSTLLSSPRF